jgi:hypothetical protein
MNNKIEYEKIYSADYGILTKIMTSAFNEDTSMHTGLDEDGPTGYNDGSLIKKLNEHENYESYKIIYENNIIGAYTIGFNRNDEYTLEMLFIDPSYRENHLGTLVWNHIEHKYINAQKWTVETPNYSKRNHHFYTDRCGFKFVREHTYNNDCKSFIFEKLL